MGRPDEKPWTGRASHFLSISTRGLISVSHMMPMRTRCSRRSCSTATICLRVTLRYVTAGAARAAATLRCSSNTGITGNRHKNRFRIGLKRAKTPNVLIKRSRESLKTWQSANRPILAQRHSKFPHWQPLVARSGNQNAGETPHKTPHKTNELYLTCLPFLGLKKVLRPTQIMSLDLKMEAFGCELEMSPL